MTVCSPVSRRGAARRPRFAGLTALTPAARTVIDQDCPTAEEQIFKVRRAWTNELTGTGGSLFTWPQGSLFNLPFPPFTAHSITVLTRRRSPRTPMSAQCGSRRLAAVAAGTHAARSATHPAAGMSAAALAPVLGKGRGLPKSRATRGRQCFLQATGLLPQTVPARVAADPARAAGDPFPVAGRLSRAAADRSRATGVRSRVVGGRAASTPHDPQVSCSCHHLSPWTIRPYYPANRRPSQLWGCPSGGGTLLRSRRRRIGRASTAAGVKLSVAIRCWRKRAPRSASVMPGFCPGRVGPGASRGASRPPIRVLSGLPLRSLEARPAAGVVRFAGSGTETLAVQREPPR